MGGARKSNGGWRRYWREQQRLAACVPDDPASAAAIEAHWTSFFKALPTGARVLDVATGNGVLLVWAARGARAAGRELTLTGIDLADIDPARFLPDHRDDLAAARFLGATAAEALPFADGSFDVVVSQYGLEYAALEGALGEAARVLARTGRLHWLAHADDSVVLAQGRVRLREIDLLLAADGPFAAMKAYLDARARGRRVQRATQVLTDALRSAEAYCAAHPPATLIQQLCAGILETANRLERYHPADVDRWLVDNRDRLRAQRQRTRDLLAASLSPKRLDEVLTILRAPPWSGAEVVSLDVGSAPASVGRVVTAVRA